MNNVCGMLRGPHWLPILTRFFFFSLFSFAFFALFFPLILRISSSSSILLRNTKTSLWSRRCKRQKQHPSGSGWYNECVRCDLKVYKKKQQKSGLENWLPCRRDLPPPPPKTFYFVLFRSAAAKKPIDLDNQTTTFSKISYSFSLFLQLISTNGYHNQKVATVVYSPN